jgi:hypothetical protein
VHPYLRDQLLIKILSRLTTRSNVFAVWITVGFFEVKDERTRPVKLGREIDRAEARHVRHRMFAVVDRTGLRLFRTASQTTVAAPGPAVVVPAAMSGGAPGGRRWRIQAGSVLVIELGSARGDGHRDRGGRGSVCRPLHPDAPRRRRHRRARQPRPAARVQPAPGARGRAAL